VAPDDVIAEGAVVRSALRATQSDSGMSSTIATGSTWYFLAMATSGLRPAACTLVASTTVMRRRPSACRARSGSASKASVDADWSFSSSATSPRK